VLRGGVAVGPLVELTVGGERWPDLHPYENGWAVQTEGSVYPLGRRRLAPYFLLHIGYFRTAIPEGSIYTRRVLGGRTTGVALGLHARVLDPLGIRLEGVARYDAGGADAQVRALVTWTPGAGRWPVPAAQAAVVVYGMARLSGPWHFVEPGYGLELSTDLTARDAARLTVSVVHWQIPGPRRLLVPYLWDTRAVLLMPGWQRGRRQGSLRWYLEAGPAMSLMFEGPDYGLRAGAQVELGGSIRWRSVPGVTAGVGYLWVTRGAASTVPATDQRGLLAHAGIAF
jgi:hypothetical protein